MKRELIEYIGEKNWIIVISQNAGETSNFLGRFLVHKHFNHSIENAFNAKITEDANRDSISGKRTLK